MNDAPLIYTSKGNLPIDSLEYSTAWTEDEDNIYFQETHKLDGEVVKQSCHVRAKVGLPPIFPEQGQF